MRSIDWWLIDICKKLCHIPSQKSGLLVKGLFTTKALFSAEGSFGRFFGGKNAGIPMDSIWECLKKNTRGPTKINHFQRILGRSLLSVTYPYDVIHLRFLWLAKHQGTSNHVFKCNFSICDTFVAPISGWQMDLFFQLWHHFARVQWTFGVAYWTTSFSPSSN